jgi:hypothetical protein
MAQQHRKQPSSICVKAYTFIDWPALTDGAQAAENF